MMKSRSGYSRYLFSVDRVFSYGGISDFCVLSIDHEVQNEVFYGQWD
jgi:hypothetical protein